MTTTPMSEVDRTVGIGGSDAPRIWMREAYPFARGGDAAVQLYAEKVGLSKGVKETHAMMVGTVLEPFIRDRLATLLSLDIEECGPFKAHPEREWMRYSLDGICRVDGLEGRGVLRGIEIKTTSAMDLWGETWSDGTPEFIPEHVWIQCQHNMEAADIDFMTVCVVNVAGFREEITASTKTEAEFLRRFVEMLEIRCYNVQRDRRFATALVRCELDFWGQVQSHTAPTPITVEEARTLWPIATPGTQVEARDEAFNDFVRFVALKEQSAKIEKDLAKLKRTLAETLEGASALTLDGVELLTFKNPRAVNWESLCASLPPDEFRHYSTKFDQKAYREENPGQVAQFFGQVGARRMVITKAGRKLAEEN